MFINNADILKGHTLHLAGHGGKLISHIITGTRQVSEAINPKNGRLIRAQTRLVFAPQAGCTQGYDYNTVEMSLAEAVEKGLLNQIKARAEIRNRGKK